MAEIFKAILFKKRGLLYFFFCAAVFTIAFARSNPLFAEGGPVKPQKNERLKIEDNLIASTFKILAKLFVATVDTKKLKKDNIKKINKMDEEKFSKRYVEVYKVIKYCPVLMARYQVNEDMTKKQAIAKIKLLDKKQLYDAIDLIPDSVIAGLFKEYLHKKGQDIRQGKLIEQVKQVWNKIVVFY